MTNYRLLARSPKTTNRPGLAGHIGRKFILGEPISEDFVCGTRITVIKAREEEGLLLCAREDGEALFRIEPEHLEAMATEESDEQRLAWLHKAYPHIYY